MGTENDWIGVLRERWKDLPQDCTPLYPLQLRRETLRSNADALSAFSPTPRVFNFTQYVKQFQRFYLSHFPCSNIRESVVFKTLL
ncbi:hypothetical protein KPSB59_190058 [Klebsiella quasipneumoniae subsp. quasipneumoniae]|nr:hypothetical protein KPSB59_190058 [Klebsiella quasipneumoniae subsp. quasipneumoniae]